MSQLSYVRLQPHVKTGASRFEIQVGIQRLSTGFRLLYEIRGPLKDILIPTPNQAPPGELWKHTCLEFFVKSPDQSEYWEWNFSPAKLFNFFSFSDYRKRQELQQRGDGGIRYLNTQQPTDSLFIMHVVVEAPPSGMLQWLLLTESPLLCSATAILEESSGNFQYWATTHPKPHPDFHAAEGILTRL